MGRDNWDLGSYLAGLTLNLFLPPQLAVCARPRGKVVLLPQSRRAEKKADLEIFILAPSPARCGAAKNSRFFPLHRQVDDRYSLNRLSLSPSP